MDLRNQPAIVETRGPSFEALEAFTEGGQRQVRISRLPAELLDKPDHRNSGDAAFKFTIVRDDRDNDNGNAIFALKSQLGGAFLGLSRSDRRLLLRNIQQPVPDNFRFKLAPNVEPIDDVSVPFNIVALDGLAVHDPSRATEEVLLSLRILKGESKSIDRAVVEQLTVLSAIGEDTEDAATAAPQPSGEPAPESNLDNRSLLDSIREMRYSGELAEAKAALGEYFLDCLSSKLLSPSSMAVTPRLHLLTTYIV